MVIPPRHLSTPCSSLLDLARAITRLADDEVTQDAILDDLLALKLNGEISGAEMARRQSEYLNGSLTVNDRGTEISPFDPFDDFSSQGYLRIVTGDGNPEIVKSIEHLAFASNIEQTLQFLASEKSLSYRSFLTTHKMLFSDIYPWAGMDRKSTSPHLVVAKGRGPSRIEFARPDDIERSVEFGLKIASSMCISPARAGEVLGYLAFAHPFLDGNGRSMLLLHTELCRRAGFQFRWADIERYSFLTNLSIEIEDPSRQAMNRFLEPFMIGL